jgi:ubiquitin ligase complex F-box protein UFO1
MREPTSASEQQNNELNSQDEPRTSGNAEYKKFRQNGSVPGLYYLDGSKTQSYDPLGEDEEEYDDYGNKKDKRAGKAAQSFPPEILIDIFSHLPPESLDSCSLVCRHWYDVLSNDASWRASFERIFSSKDFNRVTTSLKWRTELVSRLDYVHKWRKGTMKNVSFNGQVREITNVFPDLSSCRTILFSSILGAGVIADPTKGKLANPRIFTEKTMQLTSDLNCVDGSRFGMLYGMSDGKVCTLLFSQETRIHDYIVMKNYRHVGEVTAVWINKIESPRDNNNEKRVFFGALSGGMNGCLASWDLEQGSLIREYSVTTDPTPIVHIRCDHLRNMVVVVTQAGDLYALFNPESQFVKIGHFEPLNPATTTNDLSFFEVDFMAGYAVYANESGIYRFKVVEDPEQMETVLFQLEGNVVTVAMDNTVVPDTGSNKDTPGKNHRFLAASTDNDLVYVWVLQSEPVYDGAHKHLIIKPLRVTASPFQVEVSSLPGVTAIALNSLVLLLGSYNGVTIAYELLTGEFLRVVSTRFSKRALNLRTNNNFAEPGLFPITKLEIDSDPASPHGIIVVGSAVQYFDLGANIDARKKLGVRKKRRGAPAFNDGATDREEIHRNIASDLEQMRIEDKEVEEIREHNQRLHEMFNTEGLSEEDQLQYAMMLSQENQSAPSADSSVDPEDDELKRAIELSLAENNSDEHYDDSLHNNDIASDYEDEDLRRAVLMSMENEQPAASSSSQHPALDGIEDEDLKQAILLSLNDQ